MRAVAARRPGPHHYLATYALRGGLRSSTAVRHRHLGLAGLLLPDSDSARIQARPGSLLAQALARSSLRPFVFQDYGSPCTTGHRGDPSRAWLVQPCVDVTSSGKAGLLEAHDLAVGLQPAMILPAIQDALARRGLGKLAEALQADSHGGLSGPADTAVLNELRAQIANGARPSSAPSFLPRPRTAPCHPVPLGCRATYPPRPCRPDRGDPRSPTCARLNLVTRSWDRTPEEPLAKSADSLPGRDDRRRTGAEHAERRMADLARRPAPYGPEQVARL